MSVFNEADVISQGFKPLKRTATEPKVLGHNKPLLSRAISFAADSGKPVREQSVWESTSWSKFERARGRNSMSRSNSFVFSTTSRSSAVSNVTDGDTRSRSQSIAGDQRDMIVVVDPFSTGAHLAAEVSKEGYKCAQVLSIWDSPVAALVQQGLEVEFTATVQHDNKEEDQDKAIDKTVSCLRALPYNIIAILAGAETGVELADSLSHRMGLRSNGEEGSLARRNKYFMGEKVRDAGVRAVKQRNCTNMAELRDFLQTLPQNPFKCVVKPVQSAGSDDVFLCGTYEEAETAFGRIVDKRNSLGLFNESVLAQEYLSGTEYVVDKVSRDGVHKVVAVWQYDKRPCNGASFVYFGMRLMRCDDPKVQEMIKYADAVLDALGIMQGPSHMEVMYCADGPCLVEVGSRCQGGEGTWLPVAKECIGYTQVEVCLDAYLQGRKWFKAINKDAYPAIKYGFDIDLVARYSGIVRSMPGEDILRKLKSFRSLHWEIKVGNFSPKTIDCFTRPGCVQLVHEDEATLLKDFNAVHELEKMGMLDYSVICPVAPTVGAVVVVDAFSSGANLAAMIVKFGYKLILVFSERDSPIASLVSKGTNLEPISIIQHDANNSDKMAAVDETLKGIEGCGQPILAILSGAETGVELADRLAARHGTRGNGEERTEIRRDKFLMQEAAKAAGLRSIKQKLCRSQNDVDQFCAQFNGGEFIIIVKPNNSAGSDSVFKCSNEQEVKTAFETIHGHINGLGQLNDGALVQEYLQGTEYVIDGVSRDGVYKTVAIWEYDKRSVNGANFVYFGMSLRDGGGAQEQQMIAYAEKVCQAMGIMNGPSHMEVILTSSGPCLVEVGSRCHGGEGSWLPVAKECIGYTQLEATCNAYLRPDAWDTMPKHPTLLKSGCEAFLVSHENVTGLNGRVLSDIPGLADITAMESFRRIEMLTQPGNLVKPTIDCFTRPGSVQMVNSKQEVLLKEYEEIRRLEKVGLFEFKYSVNSQPSSPVR